MPSLVIVVKIAFYALMALSIFAAIAVVTLPNIFHAALALVGVLLGIAGVYLILQAEFLAMVQVLIYVGAVMTLVIFAIMLTHGIGDKTVRQKNELGLSAFAGAVLLLTYLSQLILKTPWPSKVKTINANVTTLNLGQAMMGHYVFPFEVISVVLIAVLIGAIVIAKKEKEL